MVISILEYMHGVSLFDTKLNSFDTNL